MHFAVLILIIFSLIMIYYREHFIQQFDMILKDSSDPIYFNYMGRKKDLKGYDYFDHRLYEHIFNNAYKF